MNVSMVTVLICTYNRASFLRETLRGIVAARRRPDYDVEVLVVDNNSSDETAEVVRTAAAASPVAIRYEFEARQGKSFALNLGLSCARGEVIAHTDDDVWPDEGWLDRIVDVFRARDVTFAFGKVRPRWEGVPPPEMLTRTARRIWGPLAILDYGDDVQEYDAGKSNQQLPVGANLAFSRQALIDIGGWRTDLGKVDNSLISGEDHEIFYRLKRAGAYRGLYDPQISVRHFVPASRLTRRYFRTWFYWHGKTLARMPEEAFGLDFTRVPHVAGVPRFMYRQLAQRLSLWTRAAVRRDALATLVEELQVIEYVGMFAQDLDVVDVGRAPGGRGAPRTDVRCRPDGAGAMSAPLRVAIVAPSLDILGGQAVQAQRLLQGWSHDPDVEAFLVPVNPRPPQLLAGARRVKGLRTLVTQALYWPSLLRALLRADVVHVFSASYLSFVLAPLPAILVSRALGKRVLLNYRSGEAPDHLQRSALARAAIRKCDGVAVPSAFLAGVFAGHGIATRIVPNTLDLDRFAFRRRVPLRPNLLSTRSLEPMYNVACTLRAFRLVQDRHAHATLTLAGGGSQGAALAELAGRLRLEHVRFIGPVRPDDIWRLYADADIYVQTPDIDNMPASVLEAFSSGTPVVATSVGGVPAILDDGIHGLLAAANDHEAVARHVLRLLDDPGLSERLTSAARASCERYRWASVRGEWLAIYRDLARKRMPAAPEVRHA